MLDNEININEIIKKYEIEYLKKIDESNVKKIIKFLRNENVDYIDELIEDYLYLFLIEYEEFKTRYYKLKQKYGENIVGEIANDLSILDDF